MSTPHDFVLKDFVPFKLAVLTDAFSRRLARDYADRFGISVAEWRVLAMVSQEDKVRAQKVADETPLDKVAVSRAVASLEGKGLISKQVSAEDRRAALISLTQEGRRVVTKIQRRALAFEEEALSVLSTEEQAALRGLLDRLNKHAMTL
jgi:DNA-binding MarR family transcriptional regulator